MAALPPQDIQVDLDGDTPTLPSSTLDEEQKTRILDSITGSNKYAWCSGLIELKHHLVKLFYERNDGGADVVHLATTDTSSLTALYSSCTPMESRAQDSKVTSWNVRSLDVDRFSIGLCPERIGMEAILRDGLVVDGGILKITPRRIDVYAQGSFSGSPEKEVLNPPVPFGTLVFVFPTFHEGGSLVLNTDGQTEIVDFAKLLDIQPQEQGIYARRTENNLVDNKEEDAGSDTSSTHLPSKTVKIAYAAFFGHVEHEILEVSTGYQVSLVCDFVFSDVDEPRAIPLRDSDSTIPSTPSAHYPPPSASKEIALKRFHSSLTSLLVDPNFLPTGGLLGFQLSNWYKDDSSWYEPREFPAVSGSGENKRYEMKKSWFPREIFRRLRGLDSVLRDVCAGLKLTNDIFYVYECGDFQVASGRRLLLNMDIVYLPETEFDPEVELQLAGVPLVERNTTDDPESQPGYFTWVHKSQATEIESPYVAGDEMVDIEKLRLEYLRAYSSLIVFIGPPGKRENYEVCIPLDDGRVHWRHDQELRMRQSRRIYW